MQGDYEFSILQQTELKRDILVYECIKKTIDHFEVDQARSSQLLYLSKCSP